MKRGLKLITDEGAIREMASKVIEENPNELKAFREVSISNLLKLMHGAFEIGNGSLPNFRNYFSEQGKTRLFGFFVGKTLGASGGRADPVIINSVLKELLEE